MNQPNAPMLATRPVAAESPDILGMLRRYAWLLIAGAAVGAVVSGGIFEFLRRTAPRYTARIPFQVLSRPPQIGDTERGAILLNQEEASQLINRQVVVFDQDTFLTEILGTTAFKQDPDNADKPSKWEEEFGVANVKRLRQRLRLVPRMNAATFEITMTSSKPLEAKKQVEAAAANYEQFLQNATKAMKLDQLNRLQSAVKKAQDEFDTQNRIVANFAAGKEIDVMRSKFEVEKTLLQGLNADWIKAYAESEQAAAQLTNIKGMTGDALTPDMEQFIEADQTYRYLKQTRIGLEQEKAAALVNVGGPSRARLTEIDARLAEVDKQTAERKKDLISDAKRWMLEKAENNSRMMKALSDSIQQLKEGKEKLVRDLGQDLFGYQQQVEFLKEKQEMLQTLEKEFKFSELNQFTDNTRVSRMFPTAALPSETSFPKWYMFIPAGTAIGFGLAAGLAYVLMLTDKRVRTPRDLTRTLQLPMLGFVPDEGDDRMLNGNVETAILTSPNSMVTEAFRQIRNQITAQTAHAPVNTLLVASITPGGGSTTVATNIAAAMALNDLRVLLIDSNFYRPGINRVFKGVPAEGLSNVVRDSARLADAIVPHPNLPKLHLLGAGNEGGSSEVFESKAFRDLLEQLKGKYDLIIFDGAPLNLVSDSLAIAARVDGVIPVVRAGAVSRGAVSRVRDQLRGVHANLLGFVLNAAQTSKTGYFKENYRSFHRYAGKSMRRPVQPTE